MKRVSVNVDLIAVLQRWNDNKCRCECEELIDKDVCDKGFIWNPSNEWNLSVNVINHVNLLSI